MEAEPLSDAHSEMWSSAERASFWNPPPRMSRQTGINFMMGVWRNGSASDFDCHSLSEGCSFEYCHAHSFRKFSFGVYVDAH